MKKRIIITTLIIASIHFVLAFGVFTIAFILGMETLNDHEHHVGLFEKASQHLSLVLLQPGLLCWTSWMSKHLPDFMEWIFWGFNSLLWGLVIALLINVKNIINKKENSDNKAVEETS